MCGIAGFAARTLPESALESVRAMTDSMARRGPDAQGFTPGQRRFRPPRLAILI